MMERHKYNLAALLAGLAVAGPARAQEIDLSPVQNVLQGIVDALTGPLGLVLGTLALIGVVALPAVLLYIVAAEPVLVAIFGQAYAEGAGALPVLAVAMTLLACAYLSVQYLLALESVELGA